MSPEEFRLYGHRLIDWLADYHESLAERPVMAKTKPGEIRDALPAAPPDEPEDFAAVIADLDRVVAAGLVALAASALLRLFPRQRASCGHPRRSRLDRARRDRALVAIEPGGDRSRGGRHRLAAPDARPLAGLERRDPGHRLDQRRWSRSFAPASGRRTTRWRAAACRAKRERRASTSRRTPTARSTRARCSPASAATICGSSRSTTNTRCAPTRSPRWSPPIIANGDLPCAIVATVGTTATTAIDPVAQIAEVARRHGIWLHVDAAMAGSAMILPECRWMWEGVEGADSLVINAHKWLGAPFDCSLYYVRDPEHLMRVMSTNPSFLQSSVDGEVKNLRDWGIPLGRRFRALKLWFIIREQGVSGLQTAPAPRHRQRPPWLAERVAADAGLAGRRAGQPADGLRPPRAGRARRRSAGQAHDRLGRGGEPLRRGLPHARDPRRALDGARVDRRAGDRGRRRRGRLGGDAGGGGGAITDRLGPDRDPSCKRTAVQPTADCRDMVQERPHPG